VHGGYRLLCTIYVISLASPGSTVSVPFEHKENEIGNSSESSMNEMNRMQAAKPNFQPLGIINRKEKY